MQTDRVEEALSIDVVQTERVEEALSIEKSDEQEVMMNLIPPSSNQANPIGEREEEKALLGARKKTKQPHSQKDIDELEGAEITKQQGESTRTPKRKLSPTCNTPLGKGRKRTTSVNSSPQLRQRLELVGDTIGNEQEQQRAPDLLQGVGRL